MYALTRFTVLPLRSKLIGLPPLVFPLYATGFATAWLASPSDAVTATAIAVILNIQPSCGGFEQDRPASPVEHRGTTPGIDPELSGNPLAPAAPRRQGYSDRPMASSASARSG